MPGKRKHIRPTNGGFPSLFAFVEFHLCGESRFSPKSFLGRFAELPFASAREKPSAGGVRAAL